MKRHFLYSVIFVMILFTNSLVFAHNKPRSNCRIVKANNSFSIYIGQVLFEIYPTLKAAEDLVFVLKAFNLCK